MFLVSKKSVGINFGSKPPTFVEARKLLGRIDSVISGSLAGSAENGGLYPIVSSAQGTTTAGRATEAAPSAENLTRLTGADEVIVGLPLGCFVLRFLEFPDLNEAEINGLLSYELDRYLPFPPEKALYGFQKMTRHQGKAQVLVVAARREEVEGYLAQVERLGLQPTGVTLSSIGALNAFLFDRRNGRRGVHSLISLNGKEADVSVIKDGVLLSSRSLSLDNGSFESVFAELNRITAVCSEAPGKVFVSGETGDFSTRLQQALGIQAEEWSPRWPGADASAFGLALGGLAKFPLRIDLLPPERRKKKREQAVSVLFGLLGLIAVLGGSLAINSAVQERSTLNWLDQRLAKVRTESATVTALRRETARLEDRLRLFNSLLEKQEQPLLVLKELTQLFPPSVSLNDFSLQDDKAKVSGSTSSSASELISVLERSPIFENAAFVSPISSQGKDRQRFQLQALVKTRYPKTDQVSKTPAPKGRR